MKREFQRALRGFKEPLAFHHRVAMVLAVFLFSYFGLWLLHLLYTAKRYVLLVLALLLLQFIGIKAGRLLRMAVISPSKGAASASTGI
jgi:hypothetical protein